MKGKNGVNINAIRKFITLYGNSKHNKLCVASGWSQKVLLPQQLGRLAYTLCSVYVHFLEIQKSSIVTFLEPGTL